MGSAFHIGRFFFVELLRLKRSGTVVSLRTGFKLEQNDEDCPRKADFAFTRQQNMHTAGHFHKLQLRS